MAFESESMLADYIKWGVPSFVAVKEQLVRDYTLGDMPLTRYKHNANILFKSWQKADRSLW